MVTLSSTERERKIVLSTTNLQPAAWQSRADAEDLQKTDWRSGLLAGSGMAIDPGSVRGSSSQSPRRYPSGAFPFQLLLLQRRRLGQRLLRCDRLVAVRVEVGHPEKAMVVAMMVPQSIRTFVLAGELEGQEGWRRRISIVY